MPIVRRVVEAAGQCARVAARNQPVCSRSVGLPRGTMNKLEASYAAHLRQLELLGTLPM